MQIIFSPYLMPEFNLAAGEYFFLYVDKPSVIIGLNQTIENKVDMDFCRANDISIVRRLSD